MLTRGEEVVFVSSMFTALAGLFILLRCISRFIIVKNPGAEDYLIILALFLSIGTTVDFEIQRRNGLGKHAETVSPGEVVRLLQLLFASVFTYNLGLFLCKGSILYQYLRFFVDRKYRQAAWSMIGVIAAGGTAFLFCNAFSCTPVSKAWFVTKPGHCINRQAYWYSMAAFNLLTDIIVWALPMPVIWALQMPRKQKISLLFAFALGGFGCIVSILRLHGLYQATITTDLTYANVSAATWSSVELNVGLMCACIPALRPVINVVFPRLLSSTNHGTHSNPFTNSNSRSAAYYQRHESAVELSHTRKTPSDTESLSFEAATNDPAAIHVKTEWTITENENHANAK